MCHGIVCPVGSWHLQLSFLHRAGLLWLSFSVHSEHTDVYFHNLFRLILRHFCVGVAGAGWAASPGSPFNGSISPACGGEGSSGHWRTFLLFCCHNSSLNSQLQGILLIQGQDLISSLYVSVLMGLRITWLPRATAESECGVCLTKN